uniref:Uncharacterized protein n=1 Tax=Fundulus heteroclitus TaxID=8078 RepID=A0A3Q2R2R7_FUNHE
MTKLTHKQTYILLLTFLLLTHILLLLSPIVFPSKVMFLLNGCTLCTFENTAKSLVFAHNFSESLFHSNQTAGITL